MARLARVVVPVVAHHVTQRGNRRQQTFFSDDDYAAYCTLIGDGCRRYGTTVLAWCLMPNHVHLVLVPAREESLRLALGDAHRRYSRPVNFREGWRGYLWQGRFASVAMDETHLLAAVRHVELNPVRAGLVTEAADWRWSSARAHLGIDEDGLTDATAMASRIGDWQALLALGLSDAERASLRRGERTGRPLGSDTFVQGLEAQLQRPLRRAKPGRKPKPVSDEAK